MDNRTAKILEAFRNYIESANKLRSDFHVAVRQILEDSRQRKLKEVRKKIQQHG